MVFHARGLALPLLALAAGCAHPQLIPGTNVADTPDNRVVVGVVEKYRERLLAKDIDGILALASPHYFEDSGTPRADDDYGYEGLRAVLDKRLSRVKAMRYEIEYRRLNFSGGCASGQQPCTAEVEVFLDGSFELTSESGDRYRRVNDYAHFMLERVDDAKMPDGFKWLFTSGM